MKVHHLNCGTMCPLSAKMINGEGSLFKRGRMVCHCLLVETEAGLVLIDTGIGLQDITTPGQLGGAFNLMARPLYKPAETAAQQVEALGFSREDVRHIIPTHLDLDHAGGLADFPHATVHIHARELEAATRGGSLNAKSRYIPRQWRHEVRWEAYEEAGEPWFGLEAVRALKGLPPELLMIPLFGHSKGHTGVAVQGQAQWLLHCGDAYFHHGQVQAEKPWCPAGVVLFETFTQWSRALRVQNQQRLRDLGREHGEEVSIFCAHDPVDFARFGGMMDSPKTAS